MSVTISDDVLRSAGLSAGELKRELAVMLFQQERLTLGQASTLAEMTQFRFQHLLASRGIAVHYDIDDFESDLQTLNELDRS